MGELVCEFRGKWNNDAAVQFVEACLNSVCDGIIIVTFKCRGDVNVREKMVYTMKSFYKYGYAIGNENEHASIVSESSESDIYKIKVNFKSLPLGNVVSTSCRSPVLRIDSHLNHVAMKDWIIRLGKVPFHAIQPVNKIEFKIILNSMWAERDELMQTLVAQPSENRKIEHKLFDSLTTIKAKEIFKDLKDSFTECVFSAVEDGFVEIWFGIFDDSRSFIGLPNIVDLKKIFVDKIEEWARTLFPPLPPSCIVMNVFEVEGTCPQDWRHCVKQTMPIVQAQWAIRCLLGRACVDVDSVGKDSCVVYADSDCLNALLRVYQPHESVVQIDSDLESSHVDSETTASIISVSVQQWEAAICAANILQASRTNEKLNVEKWSWVNNGAWEACEEELFDRRVAVLVKIFPPVECCGTVFNPSDVPVRSVESLSGIFIGTMANLASS